MKQIPYEKNLNIQSSLAWKEIFRRI